MKRSNSQTLPLLIAALLSSGFGSCRGTLAEICNQGFPKFARSLEDATFALAPWDTRTGRSRAIASVNGEAAPANPAEPPVAAVRLEEKDRDAWSRWARLRLDEAQAYVDYTAPDPHLRPLTDVLTRMANELVTFHGYADRGDARQLLLSLERLRELHKRAETLACHG